MYIIFEGIDTCGKTTQLKLLKEKFKDAIFTKEPGGTKAGEKIRDMLLNGEISSKKSELFLFLADRAEHYEKIVKPNRDKKWVFSDRGFISGIAYAITNHNDIDSEILIKLNKMAIDDDMPEIIIIMATNESLIKKRLGKKTKDMIERRGIEYLLKVQDNMIKILEKLRVNFVIVDASKSIEDIYKDIINTLGKLK